MSYVNMFFWGFFLIKGWKGARRNIWRSVTHCSDCIKATHADVRSYDSSNSVHYHWRKMSPLQNRSRLHLVRRGEILGENDAEKEKRKRKKKGNTSTEDLQCPATYFFFLTNTTSTSVCSPTNSWMQYTTLIYPVKNQACGDLRERSALGGRRLRFGSANLTVVGRESHGNGTALFFFFFFQPYKFFHLWSSNDSRKIQDPSSGLKQSSSYLEKKQHKQKQ